MYIDTHCHINFKAFKKDYQEAIERAIKNEVLKMIVVGSNLETSEKAIEIAEKSENVYASVGLHPIHVGDENFDERFEKLAQIRRVVAIGETGLDYYYDKTSAEFQKNVFQKSIKLAKKLTKPIIIHCREAGEDLMSLLMSESHLPRGVFHCFSENNEFAQVVLEMGFYLSFTGIITFSKNPEIVKVIENAPLEKIMIETDSPYLTPRPLTPERSDGGRADPYRGQRNEPAYVIEVAKKIAEIKKLSLDEVASQTTRNAIDLFGLK